MTTTQLPEPADDLQALKRQLSELESLRLLYPDDLEILAAKRALRGKIREMENEPAQPEVAELIQEAKRMASQIKQPSDLLDLETLPDPAS